ncbi:MAG TPA: protein kinase, partial [Sandaracinaceae bacterium LLY-WYZ-13_1]|nr:protein kinase [Sandaracinaceae bacterium LLY-WYZ-13_1]
MGNVVDRKYELLRPLGEGAMGTVHEAVHVVTRQRVAVKVLHRSPARDARATEDRFLREVRLAAELDHPNVARVLDAGRDEADGTLYIAMELLEGEDLERRVFERGATRRQALEWILEVLPALSRAHERGIVHRDLKPENLFVAEGPNGLGVKLLDFGIARSRGGTSVTKTGSTVGTPLYMSPEQALRPQDVDARADLWSVGVMLYEIVCGSPPFEDENPHAVVLRSAAEPHAPLREVAPGIDPRLERLIDRCLAKDPSGRPADAAEVAAHLEAVLGDPSGGGFLDRPVARAAIPRPRTESPVLELAAAAHASSRPPEPPTGDPGGDPSGDLDETLDAPPEASAAADVGSGETAIGDGSVRSSAAAANADGDEAVALPRPVGGRRRLAWAALAAVALAVGGLVAWTAADTVVDPWERADADAPGSSDRVEPSERAAAPGHDPSEVAGDRAAAASSEPTDGPDEPSPANEAGASDGAGAPTPAAGDVATPATRGGDDALARTGARGRIEGRAGRAREG